MCINIYTRDNHVLVRAYVIKGHNDDSLSWPFTGTVTIELLNQLEDKNHHKETITFTGDDLASQRVVDGEERGRFSHAYHRLNYNASKNAQYLKDDTLVFRVSVQVPDYKPWLEPTI